MHIRHPYRLGTQYNSDRSPPGTSFLACSLSARWLWVSWSQAPQLPRNRSKASCWSTAASSTVADAQVPWGLGALNGEVSSAAWHGKPSWYLLTTHDRMIPPPLQRMRAEHAGAVIVESPGSHAVYESRPADVAALIEQAATELTGTNKLCRRAWPGDPSGPIRHGTSGVRPDVCPDLARLNNG